MNSWDKLDEQQLPAKEAFYSKRTDSHIRAEDYVHAEKVWRTFTIHTMRGYHNLYMMSILHPFSLPLFKHASNYSTTFIGCRIE